MNVRKGQHFVRKSDGFVFVAASVSQRQRCALLQAVDATHIATSCTFERVEREFVRVHARDIVFPIWHWPSSSHIVTFVDRASADDFVRDMNNPLRGATTCRIEHAAKGSVR